MSDPYIGEIRLFAGNFAPQGWAFCDGALVSIQDNDALFSLIGTTYGGDGQTTFGLPDLRGRVPVSAGAGPGLSSRALGESGGVETVTLTTSTMASHTHQAFAADDTSLSPDPTGRVLGHPVTNTYRAPYAAPSVAMSSQGVWPVGGNQPHENVAPSLVISFIISLYGVYPSPS
ncbi:phage tail protein [Nostocoides sp. F2B08]|uniref:phage tail protein n=1 Tax=Nostocoides sp. F2B08 TaxID=2653936 RepID=UPI001262FDF1|nr:tail fiber protein [Tetrasphaera sp. F2B08]KAB7744117.1 phage tail protein [Tetrasphaera sp. F2B08]